MSWAAFRTSAKFYTHRPAARFAAARIAWDCLSLNGERRLESMRLLDGQWMAKIIGGELDGQFDEVDAGWVTNQTRRVLKPLSTAIDRRFPQGR